MRDPARLCRVSSTGLTVPGNDGWVESGFESLVAAGNREENWWNLKIAPAMSGVQNTSVFGTGVCEKLELSPLDAFAVVTRRAGEYPPARLLSLRVKHRRGLASGSRG